MARNSSKPDLTQGIAVDAAHSMKNQKTEFQGVDLKTGDIIFYQDIGSQTVNLGEFLAIVEAMKYIIKNDYQPRIIYSDSVTAISWIRNKATSSNKINKQAQKAEIFLKACAAYIDDIQVIKWNNKEWGEIPADFGRK